MYQGGAPGVGSGGGAAGGDSNNGGGCSRSPIAEAAERRGVESGVETGGGEAGLGKEAGDAVDNELLNKSLDAVRHRVKHYRMYLKPSFQVSTPKGGVTRRVECNVRSRKKSFKPHASPPNSTPSCVPTKVSCTKWHPVSILRFHSKARARRCLKQMLAPTDALENDWTLCIQKNNMYIYATSRHSINIRTWQDFDPNRKKKITRQQFLSVLGNMNLSLTEREQEAICRRCE